MCMCGGGGGLGGSRGRCCMVADVSRVGPAPSAGTEEQREGGREGGIGGEVGEAREMKISSYNLCVCTISA